MSDCGCCGTDMTPTLEGGTRHEARGLCEPCYKREDYHGRLGDYPRRTWSRDELLDEWELLRGEGHTRVQAAERVGMSPSAFDRALQRARAAGDRRAARGVPGGMTGAIAAAERASAAARAALEPAVPAEWVPAREMGDDHAMAR